MLSIALMLLAGAPQQTNELVLQQAAARLDITDCRAAATCGKPNDRYRLPLNSVPRYSAKDRAVQDSGMRCGITGAPVCPSETHAFWRSGEDSQDTIRGSLSADDN